MSIIFVLLCVLVGFQIADIVRLRLVRKELKSVRVKLDDPTLLKEDMLCLERESDILMKFNYMWYPKKSTPK